MKRFAAAILLSALFLTACGTDKDDTEPKQTVSASEETVLTEETTLPPEPTTTVSRTKEEDEEYSRMMGTANCVVTTEVVSVEGEPTLGLIYETTAPETESVKLNENAELCLSKLKFGMSRSEAEAAVDAELVEDALSPFYSIYNDISVDIDEKFNGAMFTYGESGLDEAALYSLSLTEEECAALRDRIIDFFSAAYGFSADDWEIEENSDYCKKDGVSIFTRAYLSDGSYSLGLLITSWDHRNFKNQEQYPILP